MCQELCDDVLATLPRVDQRRMGHLYVQGLVSVPGRKSIRRICEQIIDRPAEQRLQQFVNQSPWRWEPVLGRLAGHLHERLEPLAWVVTDAVFPKHGSSSVGVARQYVPSLGTAANCQLAVAVVLVGASGAGPVNWRLLLPREWGDDEHRRARCHVPRDAVHRPRWEVVVDALDESLADWGLPVAPVVLDARSDTGAEALLTALERRGLPYVVSVLPGQHLGAGAGRPSPTVAEAAAAGVRNGVTCLGPAAGETERGALRFVAVPVGPGPGARSGGRRIVVETPPPTRRPRSWWATNLPPERLAEHATLVECARRASSTIALMGESVGLRHFEGRSYQGWHHHVAAASVAHAVHLFAHDVAAGPDLPLLPVPSAAGERGRAAGDAAPLPGDVPLAVAPGAGRCRSIRPSPPAAVASAAAHR